MQQRTRYWNVVWCRALRHSIDKVTKSRSGAYRESIELGAGNNSSLYDIRRVQNVPHWVCNAV